MTRLSITAVIAGFFTVFIHYSVRYGYGMLLPEMLPVLEITKTEAGIIGMFFFIIYTALAPITGGVSDHLSFRLILPVSVFILGLGALLLSTASSMWQTSLFYSIAAVGGAGCWAPVMVFVQKAVPNNKKGLAVSLVGTGTCLGIFLTSMLLPLLVSNFDWRSGWIMLGLTGICISLLNFILIKNPESDPGIKPTTKFSLSRFFTRYQSIFKQPNFWLIAVAYLFVGFNMITIFTFLSIYASETLHVPYALSTRFIGVIAAAGIIGQLCLGCVSDKIGRKPIMIICGVFLSVPCLGFALSSTIWILFILAGCWGFGYGAVCAIYSASASDFFSRDYTGGVVGMWTAFLGLGSILASYIGGRLIDFFNSYTWLFVIAMVVAALSSILVLGTRKSTVETTVA